MQKQLKNAYASAIKNAQDELAVQYIPAVRAMGYRLYDRLPKSIEVNDLISVGMEELIKLARRYDETQNDNFWGYAKKRVHGAMLDYLRSLDTISRENRKIVRDVENIINKYMSENDEEPSDEYLAKELNIDVEKIKEARIAQAVSYVMPLSDQVEIVSSENILDELTKEDLIEKITDILSTLDEREQLIIQLYFFEELRLSEISEILNIGESRICQIQNKVINLIRQRLING